MTVTRRDVVVGLAASSLATPSWARRVPGAGERIVNPLIRQRADPQIVRQADGSYTFTGSVPAYDRVILRRASTIAGLATAPEVVLWRRPAAGRMAGHIWAPELHHIDGRWLIYVAAGDGAEPFHIRTYVLQCDGADPLTGRWSVLGQLQTPWDSFTLDSTSFVQRGVRYLCWAQQEPGIATNSNLYLAPLASPTTLAAPPARLTVPTLAWEVQGFKVAEGPAVLLRNDHVFITYSASATDARYCMGMLSARADADLMDPASWTKSPDPVFHTSVAHHVYGPGHNSFTTDAEGRDILVYHARDYEPIDGDPLYDPNRHTRVQAFTYDRRGYPIFGAPAAVGVLPKS